MKRNGSWSYAWSAAQPSAYVYPQKGQTADKQTRDTSDCRAWAKQQTGFDPLTDSAKGAGVGALVGAVGGAATGAATGHAATGAAIGAAAGGIGGAGDRAFSACMSGRCYPVR